MIPNKEISRSDFLYAITYQRIIRGGEATICQSSNPYSLYKFFTLSDRAKPMSQNKLEKISRLYELKPQQAINPISTISLNDIIIGYEMETTPNLKTYKPYQLSPEELKYFLKKSKDILEYFQTLNIIYGDIDPRNILFDRTSGEIKFCDMDNIHLDNLPMDLIPEDVEFYETTRPLDFGIHPFGHNKMTLRALEMDPYLSTKREISKHFKRPAIKIIKSMQNPQNFNNEYLFQYLKK